MVTACLAAPALASAQPAAAAEFERALLREAAAREADPPTLVSLRTVAASYEAIVRRYPNSLFADSALWRAAAVLRLAYARFGMAADRVNAVAMLKWLTRNYPRSPLARRELPRIDTPRISGPATDPISVTASAVAGSEATAREVPYAADRLEAPGRIVSAAAVTSRSDYSLARQLGLRVARVVIDPGHGGQDPGARAHGLTEADVVLDVALRLDALLREEGIDVVLTRRDSAFVPLEERVAIANSVEADLFVSIHANASPLAGTSGIETYVLNLATSRESEAVAARENATSAKTMNSLPHLLTAIAQNSKVVESRDLANMVQSALVRSLSAERRSVRSLGVKQAPFVVLIGAEMPSVLVEIGFLTNRSEATALEQQAGREAAAQGLFEAVVQYQSTLKRGAAIAASENGR
jgi:N-acetylmuramoyl-L-alanine amidase